uniref:Pentatricopeptide repeat-containing protein n=1 Tax=Kalanchoe fedtschenkoi TaxID=63787 RepID=A0A7N0ZV36_KALFE
MKQRTMVNVGGALKTPLLSRGHSTYSRLLTSCTDVNSLRQIHARLIVSATQNADTHHLLNSYSSFHKLSYARSVFDSVADPGALLWNCMIRAYSRCDRYREALETYHCMLEKGVQPDKYTFTFVLKACTGVSDIDEGVSTHGQIVEKMLDGDVFIGTGLIDMYCKAGRFSSARDVFDKISHKDVAAWNAMIAGLAQTGNPVDSLKCFASMQSDGTNPNSVSFLNLFPALCKLLDIDSCKCIHAYVIRRDFRCAVYNGLIDVYLKCGCVESARRIFNGLLVKDDVSWGTMMAGCAQNGCYADVLEMFDQMLKRNLVMNQVCIVSALLAAAELRDLATGEEIHNCAMKLAIHTNLLVATPLLSMYAKCGELEKAKQLFEDLEGRDLVAWSAFISSFAQSGYPNEALLLFKDLVSENLKPNSVTLVSALPACGELSYTRLGKSLHCYAVKNHIDSDISISTALVSMYARCECFTSALTVFDSMVLKDIVTWNSLITGYTQSGEPQRAINVFSKLQLSGTPPDSGTMTSLIAAGALLNDIALINSIYGHTLKGGFQSDPRVKNALIDMYAKSGCLASAEVLFHDTDFEMDQVSWNILIAGYLQNGHARKAISAFHQMRFREFQPNMVTLLIIIPAAAKLTALREGMALHAYTVQMGFHSKTMIGNTLIDMYAKCGQLGIADKFFNEMESKDTVSWNAMLAAYAMHGHGKHAVEILFTMKESNVLVDSVSLLNALSACRHAGMVDEGRVIFNSMKKDYQLNPGLEHYSCMVDLLSRAGLFDETLEIIKSMPMEPDAALWGALLGASKLHCNVKIGELAADHLVKLEPSNAAHYVVLSSIYADSGRWADARTMRSEMMEMGLAKSPGRSWEEVTEATS